MTKVQLTLTDQEAALLASYGSKLGYSVPKIAKFFISQATAQILNDGVIPVYKMSDKNERKGQQALAEHKAGLTKKVDDPQTFFDEL